MRDLDGVRLNPLTISDLSSIASIHRRAFSRQALSRLGLGVVERYYAWQLTGPHDAVCMGAYKGDRLVGYCLGGIFRGATSGFLRNNIGYLALAAARHPWLFASSFMRERMVEGMHILWRFRKPSLVGPSVEAEKAARGYGILVIAVDPTTQSMGIGRLLMEENERVAHERGFTHMGLTVDKNNQQAVKFYESLGWTKVVNGDSWEGSMRKKL